MRKSVNAEKDLLTVVLLTRALFTSAWVCDAIGGSSAAAGKEELGCGFDIAWRSSRVAELPEVHAFFLSCLTVGKAFPDFDFWGEDMADESNQRFRIV